MKRYLKWKNEPFNTCNEWGFGGGIGTSYKNGEWEVRKGTAYFRHLKPQAFLTVQQKGKGRIDVDEKTLEQILERFNVL